MRNVRRGAGTGRGVLGALGAVWAVGMAMAPGVSGQEGTMELTRIASPPTIDGRPTDAEWAGVPLLPLTMYFPTHRGTPAQRTEIRVAYDDEFFYAAGWFYDDGADGIRINSLYRDRWNGDDAFAIYIDAFNDNQNAKWFGTTPGGIRFDLLVADDGASLNGSWNTYWDARSTVEANGWYSEVRIPLSSLGLQADDQGRVVMGLTVTRLVSRTGERVTFPDIDPQFLFRQPSVAQDVVLRDVSPTQAIHVTPYLLARSNRTRIQDPVGVYGFESSSAREIGADLRFAPTSNVTVDVTVNTDFAQVEADDQQVNLDRFPLFFPEKRQFFQERSGIFDYPSGGGSRLFHSRRIGLTRDRRPVPVLGGGRVVGRLGEWDVGFLDMQTESSGLSPSENFGVLRLRRRVLNDNSFVGFMSTSRISDDAHNVAVAGDGFLRLFGNDYLTAKWAMSFDEMDTDDVGLFDRSHTYLRWERRTNRGLMYTASTTRSGSDFRPDLGFLQRRDYVTANALANWYFFPEDSETFRRIWPGFLAFSTFRGTDGSLESGQYAVWMQWETRRGGGGWIEPKVFREDVLAPFLIGGEAEVPAGNYTFADLQVALSMANGRRLRTGIDMRAGSYFDGTRAQVILGPTWNVSPHLELGANYQYSRIRFDDRNTGTDIHVGRLRVRTAVNARASGNAFLQYNSTTDRLDLNIRLRYNFAEGTDLWLVFDEGLDVERSLEPGSVTRPPWSRGRSFVIKYTHALGG